MGAIGCTYAMPLSERRRVPPSGGQRRRRSRAARQGPPVPALVVAVSDAANGRGMLAVVIRLPKEQVSYCHLKPPAFG